MPAEPIVHFNHNVHACQAHDLAQCCAVTIPGQTALGQPVFLLRAVGGLTKLEQGALMVAAAAITAAGLDQSLADIANLACAVAETTLAECRRRQQSQEAELIAAEEAKSHPDGDEAGSRITT